VKTGAWCLVPSVLPERPCCEGPALGGRGHADAGRAWWCWGLCHSLACTRRGRRFQAGRRTAAGFPPRWDQWPIHPFL